MLADSLQTFITRVTSGWGPITGDLVARCHEALQDLTRAPVTEPWLAELIAEQPANKELYRDPRHGFVLLAHTEEAGRYRPPHDHGLGWVIYAIQQGEMDVRTYVRVTDCNGAERLVQRKVSSVRPGQAKVYLPGDIHDTRCTAGPVIYFRFTDRDLKQEERAGRLKRFEECP